MSDKTMEWVSVEECGLPKPDRLEYYFVSYPSGYGYGTFHFDYDLKNKKSLDTCRWYLDFDAVGHEDEITHYMKIIDPEGEQNA